MTTAADSLTSMKNATTMTKAKDKTASTDMDQDAFLTLMCKQLEYQDPLDPVDNSEFLSQQATFTQVSELQKMNSTMSTLSTSLASQNVLSQASSMIDKTVTMTDPDDSTKTISGKVTSAQFTSDGVTLTVDGKDYSIDLLKSISNT